MTASGRTSAESGFTLIELVVVVGVLAIIVGPLTLGILIGLRTMDGTQNRLASSHDAQLVSRYLPSDLESAGSGADDVVAAPTANTDCSGNENLLRLRWTVAEDLSGISVTYVAAYAISEASSEWRLVRYFCINGGAATQLIVAHNLSGANAGVVDVSGLPKVSLTLTEAMVQTDVGAYSYSISGTRRTT